jgi:hypothetical protein
VKRKILLLLIAALIVIGGACVLHLKKVTFLYLENMNRSRTVRVWVNPSDQFSVFYIHSIYNAPAIEEFQVDRGGITLKGVRTQNPGIMEYYGFEDTKPFHLLDRKLGPIFFRVAMGEGQGLIVRDRKIYLREVGEKGDRIRLRVGTLSLGAYLLKGISKEIWGGRVIPYPSVH